MISPDLYVNLKLSKCINMGNSLYTLLFLSLLDNWLFLQLILLTEHYN